MGAASGLMLLPTNASRLVRLHRLAALGMAIADDSRKPMSSSTARALLKRDDIGGSQITRQEDPYSEVLIRSISFFGGEYLFSPGSGEHTVGDVETLPMRRSVKGAGNFVTVAYGPTATPRESTVDALELANAGYAAWQGFMRDHNVEEPTGVTADLLDPPSAGR